MRPDRSSSYSVPEAAAILGLSENQVRRLIQKDELTAVPVGGACRLPKDAVDLRAATGQNVTDDPPTDLSAVTSVAFVVRQLGAERIEDLPLMMSVAQAAERLDCSERTLRRRIATGHFPAVTVARGRVMVPTARLVFYLAEVAA